MLDALERERAALILTRADFSIYMTMVERELIPTSESGENCSPGKRTLRGQGPSEPNPKKRRRRRPVSPVRCSRTASGPHCALCPGEHESYLCTMYQSVRGRWRRIVKRGLCKLCLDVHGPEEPCPSDARKECASCGADDHHRALCKLEEQKHRREAAGSIVEGDEDRAPAKGDGGRDLNRL